MFGPIILNGDCRTILPCLPSNMFNTCVTSPPYFGLRDYGHPDQLGLEQTPGEYVANLVEICREVRRVLRDDGTFWLNLGDSYNNRAKRGGVRMSLTNDGLKEKDLIGIPWKVAFALQADGWYLRQDIIWSKPNAMPESVTDRCTKSHEYIFMFSKTPRYYFDAESIKEPSVDPESHKGMRRRSPDKRQGDPFFATKVGKVYTKRNRRSVWHVSTKPFKGAHFATFPPDLIEPCVLAGAPIGGMVLDPFAGAGTTALVSHRLNRGSVSIELNASYVGMAFDRIDGKPVAVVNNKQSLGGPTYSGFNARYFGAGVSC
jgi:DNA modification methylase